MKYRQIEREGKGLQDKDLHEKGLNSVSLHKSEQLIRILRIQKNTTLWTSGHTYILKFFTVKCYRIMLIKFNKNEFLKNGHHTTVSSIDSEMTKLFYSEQKVFMLFHFVLRITFNSVSDSE